MKQTNTSYFGQENTTCEKQFHEGDIVSFKIRGQETRLIATYDETLQEWVLSDIDGEAFTEIPTNCTVIGNIRHNMNLL